MNIKPLGDRVLVKVVAVEEVTKSGIFLPETAQEKPLQGQIVAVGEGHRLDNGSYAPLSVKVGDHVLYAKYSGTDIRVDSEDYLILNEKDLLAVLD